MRDEPPTLHFGCEIPRTLEGLAASVRVPMELDCPIVCSNVLCGLFTKGFSDDPDGSVPPKSPEPAEAASLCLPCPHARILVIRSLLWSLPSSCPGYLSDTGTLAGKRLLLLTLVPVFPVCPTEAWTRRS